MGWINRIASWVVAAIGLVLVLLITGNWVDVIGRMLSPSLGGDADVSGVAIFGAIGATFPFVAAIWGLWHLYRLFAERAAGKPVAAARRFRAMGLALMAVAMTLVAAGYLLGGMFATTGPSPILPAHAIIFALGLVVFVLAEWRLWRDTKRAQADRR